MDYHHDTDEALGKILSVYGDKRGHVIESIFDGKTHIIPLADVAYIQRFPREDRGQPFPDLEPRIGIHLKPADASAFSQMPSIYLYGEEMDAFIRAWCTYRHELESPPAKVDVQIEALNDIFGYPHGTRPAGIVANPELNPEVTEIIKRHLENMGFVPQPVLTDRQRLALDMITPIGCSTSQRPSTPQSIDLSLCREALREAGKPYPKSNCDLCGSLLVPGRKCYREKSEAESDVQPAKAPYDQGDRGSGE